MSKQKKTSQKKTSLKQKPKEDKSGKLTRRSFLSLFTTPAPTKPKFAFPKW